MKKRLLSVLAAMMAVLSISAQNYLDLSTLKGENDETPDSVYLYNEAAKGFLCGGNAWGTQASAGQGQLYVITQQEDGTYTLKTSSGYKAGQYLFRDSESGCYIDMGNQGHQFWTITKSPVASNHYRIQIAVNDPVYGSEENMGWEDEFFGWGADIDDAGNYVTYFRPNVYADEDGVGIEWAIVSQADHDNMADRVALEAAIMKADGAGILTDQYVALLNNPSTTKEEMQEAVQNINARVALQNAIYAALDNGFELTDSYQDIVDNEKATTEDLQDAQANLAARQALEEIIYTAENEGVDVDDFVAILNNTAATTEELQEARQDVIRAIDMAMVEINAGLLEGASADDPIELFEIGILTNGDFGGVKGTDGDLEGWNATLKGNDNHRQNDEYKNGSVMISGFAESWTWNAQHGSGHGEFSRKVGLPEGLYILEVDMIATRQSGSKADSKGVQLFASNENAGEDFCIDVATANNAPEHFSLPFTTTGGVVTIGVREDNTNCNWIAMDNFKLTYYGASEKPFEQIELGKVVASIGEQYEGLEKVYGQTTIIEAYDKAFEAASTAAENGGLSAVEEYTVLGDTLKVAYNRLTGTIGDYNYFAEMIEAFQDRMDEISEAGYGACVGELASYKDDAMEMYEACNLDRKAINQVVEDMFKAVSPILCPYVAPAIEPGEDVSILLNNPTFDKNFVGWSTDPNHASPWWGPGTGQPNTTGTMADYEGVVDGCLPSGNAECFHNAFDMYQTVFNMPAGLYTITCQAFARKDDGTTADAYIYALLPDGSEVKQPVMGLWDDPSEEKLFEDGGQWYGDSQRDGMYAPNGMGGANFYFEAGHYKNKFSLLVPKTGDIQIGIKTADGHLWVLFDNFNIVYEGSGASVWVATLEEEAENLDMKALAADITDGCFEEVEAVVTKAENFIKNINSKSEEECFAMLDEMKAQYAVISENIELLAQVTSYYESMSNLYDKALDADADLQARFMAAYDKFDESTAEYMQMNNEALKALFAEADKVMALVRMPKGWEDASDSNPVDFTAMILNPQFNVDGETYEYPEDEPEAVQNHNFTEWQGKQFGTGGGQQANCGEVWNSGAFDAYQVITGLPEGTYELSCQGFLRHGGGTADSYAILNGEKEQTVYAYLYATSAAGKFSTELCNIASVQKTAEELEMEGIDISAGNSTFGEIYKGSDQLRTADNFFKAGYYNNTIVVKVGKDGVLRIGIEKVNAVGQDWVVVDNFKLTYLGANSSAQPSEDPTIINGVEAPAEKVIFDLTGRKVSKAQKGLYIINGKKVLVK